MCDIDFTINAPKIICLLHHRCFFCHVFMFQSPVDSENKPVQLLTTLDNSEVDLLILEYIKVCKNSIPSIFFYLKFEFTPYCGLCFF